MKTAIQSRPHSPSKWTVILAFLLVYLSWGTTFLAIKKGVECFPPALFGGCRVALAGLLVFVYLVARRQTLYLPLREFVWTAFVGLLMFVGGNGLLTLGEKSIASGVASILGATTPLWIAMLESVWPRGERLNIRGWVGLFIGLFGVVLLIAPKLQGPATLLGEAGPAYILGSSLSWALGSVVLRYRRIKGSYLAIAAYQMVVGGGVLILIGWVAGEFAEVSIAAVTPVAIYSFFHLLVFGSLVGFVAYVWLLGHVSAALAGTHSYVNPVVAVFAGWLVEESITPSIVGSMVIILVGVGLVRAGGVHSKTTADEKAGSVSGASSNQAEPVIIEECIERAT
jgi:drug/metabolite transporter (DMT)-like permease